MADAAQRTPPHVAPLAMLAPASEPRTMFPMDEVIAPRDVAAARQAAMGMDNASGSVVPDDFDAPLPPDVQHYFEGEDDEDPGLSQRGPLWVA